MAEWTPPTYVIAYLNPDGTWTHSAFKAHDGAVTFREYPSGSLIPTAYYGLDWAAL